MSNSPSHERKFETDGDILRDTRVALKKWRAGSFGLKRCVNDTLPKREDFRERRIVTCMVDVLKERPGGFVPGSAQRFLGLR